MSQLMRITAMLSLVALLIGCGRQPRGFQPYPTMAEALGGVLDKRVSIIYVEPFDDRRNLVLFRADDHGPSATLLEKAGRGQWRMTDAVGLGGPLHRLGALSYDFANLGHVEEKIGDVTSSWPETHVLFGQVLDPAISWVELTLDEELGKPRRATVQNGFWVVQVPPKYERTGFELKAGDGNGVRFAASVGRGGAYRLRPGNEAPLVEYRDEQQGIRLQYPIIGGTPTVKEGRLTISTIYWTVSVERKAELHSGGLDALLEAMLAGAENQVLEHGIRAVGEHEAAYVLEATPGKPGRGWIYDARYQTVAGDDGYEVTCSMIGMYETSTLEEMRPDCDQILSTVRLGSGTAQD